MTEQMLEQRYSVSTRLWTDGQIEARVALDVEASEPVTAILFHPKVPLGPSAIAAFELIARQLLRVSHPCLAEVLSFGVSEGTPYLVLADLEGSPLTRVMAPSPSVPLERLAAMVTSLGEALEAAHQVGFFHGSLSADRIYISDERALIVGIGLGQLLRAIETGAFQVEPGDDTHLGGDTFALNAIAGEISARAARAASERPSLAPNGSLRSVSTLVLGVPVPSQPPAPARSAVTPIPAVADLAPPPLAALATKVELPPPQQRTAQAEPPPRAHSAPRTQPPPPPPPEYAEAAPLAMSRPSSVPPRASAPPRGWSSPQGRISAAPRAPSIPPNARQRISTIPPKAQRTISSIPPNVRQRSSSVPPAGAPILSATSGLHAMPIGVAAPARKPSIAPARQPSMAPARQPSIAPRRSMPPPPPRPSAPPQHRQPLSAMRSSAAAVTVEDDFDLSDFGRLAPRPIRPRYATWLEGIGASARVDGREAPWSASAHLIAICAVTLVMAVWMISAA